MRQAFSLSVRHVDRGEVPNNVLRSEIVITIDVDADIVLLSGASQFRMGVVAGALTSIGCERLIEMAISPHTSAQGGGECGS